MVLKYVKGTTGHLFPKVLRQEKYAYRERKAGTMEMNSVFLKKRNKCNTREYSSKWSEQKGLFFSIILIFLLFMREGQAVYAAENTVSGNDMVGGVKQDVIPVSELDMGDYSEKMVIGEKQLIAVTVIPYNATATTITYESSHTEVATINGMGRITAVAPGTTEIKASCGDKSASFTLQVAEESGIKVTDIEIANHGDELEVDKTLMLSATVLPSDATNSTVKYSSSDTSIATVSSTGEVKGIAKGNVIIYVTAGSVTKEVPITVKVATSKIRLNSDYLVMQPKETYQLKATVTPAEAAQTVTYRSADTEIAKVSENGTVTAGQVGSTSIIVSNGDCTVSVSVIVNQASEAADTPEVFSDNTGGTKSYPQKTDASAYKIIDPDMLYYFYSTGKILEIVGEGYRMELDGSKIRNYKNRLYTDIELLKDEEGLHFVLNRGEFLCGEINLFPDECEGKYLYLYNDSKGKYEMLQTDNFSQLTLTTPGKYLITEHRLAGSTVPIRYVIMTGGIFIVVGIGFYIGLKNKYWFW